MSSGMKCRLLATLLLSIKDVAVAAQGSSKESAERDPGAWLMSDSSANSAWRHFLTDAGWAAAALLALTAVAVAVGLLIRHYCQAQGARAARALLGVSGPTASSRAAQLLMGGPGDMTPEQVLGSVYWRDRQNTASSPGYLLYRPATLTLVPATKDAWESGATFCPGDFAEAAGINGEVQTAPQ
ncbi:unnamed protein product [Polarella glacialis]|uniref:Uncharacterized protein n=1 Tax=Polarella glacialis TaxID=89957 RepID=A0A813DNV4_POLGL|nr:unnamed protein product [Polarella glacialis]